MTIKKLLGRRAVREVIRYPAATIPTLFIPLFFLAVNIGQVSKTFPSTTPFLKGQGYVAFQLPVSLIRRSSIIFGRLTADLVRGIAASSFVLLAGIALGARIESGVAGALL